MTSLRQHVEQHHGAALADVFAAIAAAAIAIQSKLALGDGYGAVGAVNVQGEQQQKLDVYSNDVLIAALEKLPTVAAVVSEEDDAPIVFAGRPDARYVCIFDPLDGSSNIDVNVNVGTIVSIQQVTPGGDAAAAALQPGTAQVAALYVNYGPSTVLVYTAGAGVHSFTLSDGDFYLSAEHITMPAHGPYYSTNEGNVVDFPAPYPAVLAGLRDGTLLERRYASRYVGSFIADFHRTLLKGGVFLYPPTHKTPGGKLRLLYEANPLAMIAEQAGGMATSGSDRILDIAPTHPHVRTPLVIGSRDEVHAIADMVLAAARR